MNGRTCDPKTSWFFICLSIAVWTSGCDSDDSGDGDASGGADAGSADGAATADADAGGQEPTRSLEGDCDPLVPEHCGFPFPSNVYLKEDPSLPGGKRVAFGQDTFADPLDPAPWGLSDGFSPGVAPMTYLPGATATGLPTPLTIEQSLEQGSPTVLIEAETGKRVAHFAELDVTLPGDDRQAFMIRPIHRLKDGTRYIVAIRNVVDKDGNTIAPSPAFAALRDDTPFDDPSIENGRELYRDIFFVLEGAGVDREELQLAWDFTTATREGNTRWLLHMRNQALQATGEAGPAYSIVQQQDDYSEYIARRIDGTMRVPLYLTGPGAGSALVLGEDGLPVQNGEADYGFTVMIPRSALEQSAPLVQYGHGLLGSREEVSAFQQMADEHNFVMFAVDWIGMSMDDAIHIGALLGSGNLHQFSTVADRLVQGMLNFLLAMRMMSGDFASDPAATFDGVSAIDPEQRYYVGASQGGIFGGTYMAVTTDVQRGVLIVGGQPYSLLLNRSVDFDIFLELARIAWPNPLDVQLGIALAQMLWDRAEPNGYTPYIRENTLPGTPSHEVLMLVSIGDHQVNNLGSHVMARAIGARAIEPAVRPIFDIEVAQPPYTGSALVEFDFGNPPDPITNVPPTEGQDPHSRIREVPAAIDQLDTFLRTGVVEHLCDGPCDPD